MTKNKIKEVPREIYLHKTREKVGHALRCLRREPVDIEGIESNKHLFRDFLEKIIQNHTAIDGFSKEDYNMRVIAAYNASDFDWRDKKKLEEFSDKYINVLYYPNK